jgi:hypothetical protein
MAASQVFRDKWLAFVERSALGLRLWAFAKPVVYAQLIIAVIVFDREAKTFVYFQF